MLRRLFFGGLHLNKGVLARFRHGLLHLSWSRNSCLCRNPQVATEPGLGDAAMTDQKPKSAWGSSRTFTLCCFAYFLGGYTLIKEYWPDSDMAFYILIAVGIGGGYLILKRRRDRS